MKIGKTLEYALVPVGTFLGIVNIKEVLGIVLLVLQILIILWNVGRSIYSKVKTGKIDEVQQDIDDALKQLKEIKKNAEDDKHAD